MLACSQSNVPLGIQLRSSGPFAYARGNAGVFPMDHSGIPSGTDYPFRLLRRYLRMPPELFDEILERVTPAIERQDTKFRSALPPGLKLSATLRHLATGDRHSPMRSGAVKQPSAIWCQKCARPSWKPTRMKCSPFLWRPMSGGPLPGSLKTSGMCLMRTGSILPSASHPTQGPCTTTTRGFSVSLSSPWWMPSIVSYGLKLVQWDTVMSDAQIYNDSELSELLEEGRIGLPPPCPLHNDDQNQDIPYFILGDDVFALRSYLIKPYGRRAMPREKLIFNYRISRGRRVEENAFGILAKRFRCFLGTLEQRPDTG